MKSITIKAATDAGEMAMRKHMEDVFKMRWDQRAMMKEIGIYQTVTSTDPYILVLEFRHRKLRDFLRPDDLLREIRNEFEANGAKEDHDYITEVQE